MTLREASDKLADAASLPPSPERAQILAAALVDYRTACEVADKPQTWQKYAVVDSDLGTVCDTEDGAKHAYLNECLGWRYDFLQDRDSAWQRCLDSGGRLVRVTVTEVEE